MNFTNLYSSANYAPAAKLGVLDRQRRRTFVYSCLAMLFADVFLWFLGMGAFGEPRYEVSHIVHFVLMAFLFVAHMRSRLSLTVGVTTICLANQIGVIIDMWVCFAANRAGVPLQVDMIMGCMVMSGMNMLLVLMAYLRALPFVVGGLSIAAYGVCCWLSGDKVLLGMLPIFAGCFLVIVILEYLLCDDIHHLEGEKEVLRNDEQMILNLLELDKSQLTAYIALAREKGLTPEQTGTLLDSIGKKARDNIRDNVAYYFRQRGIDYAGLQNRLPGLTPTEIKICDLILKEKRLKDIVRMLDTTEGNITSHRANIRRKLGLASTDNLRDALLKIADRE